MRRLKVKMSKSSSKEVQHEREAVFLGHFCHSIGKKRKQRCSRIFVQNVKLTLIHRSMNVFVG